MYKYDIWNMYDGNEYIQKIYIINNNDIIYIKSQHVFLSWHVMTNLQSVTRKKIK
jgi:hypothetical protein